MLSSKNRPLVGGEAGSATQSGQGFAADRRGPPRPQGPHHRPFNAAVLYRRAEPGGPPGVEQGWQAPHARSRRQSCLFGFPGLPPVWLSSSVYG